VIIHKYLICGTFAGKSFYFINHFFYHTIDVFKKILVPIKALQNFGNSIDFGF